MWPHLATRVLGRGSLYSASISSKNLGLPSCKMLRKHSVVINSNLYYTICLARMHHVAAKMIARTPKTHFLAAYKTQKKAVFPDDTMGR